MHLKKLNFINFKNYQDFSIELAEKINCFVGYNGVGKTNVLDGIYYLSNCKSFFNPVDSQNIKEGEEFFVVEGVFSEEESDETVYCGVKKGRKKVFKKGKRSYEKLSEHIGYINTVMISPIDGNLILEGSDVRRKYIDHIISQYNPSYLQDLIKYNKVLAHRNALLKQFKETNSFQPTSLEVWDDQLIPLAEKIYTIRKEFIEGFIPVFDKRYKKLSNGLEMPTFFYESHLSDNDFKKKLNENLSKDRAIGYTTVGIHKDDYVFLLNDKPLKKFGSQGQQKTYLIALKLAHYDFISEKSYHKPILLLDDIYDKLDEKRIKQLMDAVLQNSFGQVFITDTDKHRLSDLFKNEEKDIKVFHINDGVAKVV